MCRSAVKQTRDNFTLPGVTCSGVSHPGLVSEVLKVPKSGITTD